MTFTPTLIPHTGGVPQIIDTTTVTTYQPDQTTGALTEFRVAGRPAIDALLRAISNGTNYPPHVSDTYTIWGVTLTVNAVDSTTTHTVTVTDGVASYQITVPLDQVDVA